MVRRPQFPNLSGMPMTGSPMSTLDVIQQMNGMPPQTPQQAPQQAPQPAPERGGFMDSVGNLIKNPFLLNLLAQSGYSTTPGSPIGAVGRAALGARQMGINERRAGLEDELLRARIGLTNRQAETGGVAGNVQSTFKGDNGNMWIIKRDGSVADTGVAFNNNLQLITQPDGSVIAIDVTSGQVLGTPVSPEAAADASRRAEQTKRSFTLPTELASLDGTINKLDSTISKVQNIVPMVRDDTTGVMQYTRGGLPGALGGDARTLRQAVKSLQANLGFDTLQQMRAASKTGGALGQVSERELDLLVNAVEALDIEGDPEVLRENLLKVVTHYENYKREIEKMKNAMRQEAGQAPAPAPNKPISEYTDAELEAIIEGR